MFYFPRAFYGVELFYAFVSGRNVLLCNADLNHWFFCSHWEKEQLGCVQGYVGM